MANGRGMETFSYQTPHTNADTQATSTTGGGEITITDRPPQRRARPLKAVADEVSSSEMWFDDQVIGYDDGSLLVWEQEKSYSTPTNEYFEDYERIYG